MVNSFYSKKVIEHFLKPKFFGKIKNPDGVGEAGNPRCGDIMKLYLKIDEKNQKIKDIRFETLGCAAAVASSDIICEAVKGKTIREAQRISFKDLLEKLGKLPPLKVHCSVLVTKALKKAIKDYQNKKQGIKDNRQGTRAIKKE